MGGDFGAFSCVHDSRVFRVQQVEFGIFVGCEWVFSGDVLAKYSEADDELHVGGSFQIDFT